MNIKKQIKKYWDSRGKSYDKSPSHSDLLNVWKSLLSEIFNERRMKILDVGTGTGFIALLLAEIGHEVVGVDISNGMIEVAKRKAKKVNIEFVLGDAEDLPFDDNSFDAVTCRHLLWTLPNPKKAVIEWCRVVKVGGKVIAIDGVWFDNSLFTNLKRTIGRICVAIYERRNPWKGYFYRRRIRKNSITEQGVARIFKDAGLSNVLIRDLSWIRTMMIENKPFFYRLAWDKRKYFMVEGSKIV